MLSQQELGWTYGREQFGVVDKGADLRPLSNVVAG